MTPLQALRRLVDVTRLIDAHECGELYNELQNAVTCAGAVLAEASEAVPAAYVVTYFGEPTNNIFLNLELAENCKARLDMHYDGIRTIDALYTVPLDAKDAK